MVGALHRSIAPNRAIDTGLMIGKQNYTKTDQFYAALKRVSSINSNEFANEKKTTTQTHIHTHTHKKKKKEQKARTDDT